MIARAPLATTLWQKKAFPTRAKVALLGGLCFLCCLSKTLFNKVFIGIFFSGHFLKQSRSHWTVLRRLGFWGQNLTLHAIIARHIVHIKGNMIIFATEVSKIEKNSLKVGKK